MLQKIISILDSLAKARTVSALASMGKYEEAKKLMLEKKEVA